MPIYEFKCLTCEEYIEILVMNTKDEKMEMKCPKCGGENLERIMSTTNFSMGTGSSSSKSGPSTENRTCSSGSCTSWNLPGPS